jgi:hypothetical protein
MTFLGAEQRERLFPFDRVAMDDDGAELASAGNAHSVEMLLPFVEEVQRAVRALRKVVEHVPIPPGLEPQRAAWAAFAAAHGGVFFPGDFSIRHASYRGHKVDLHAAFDPDGFHNCSVALVRFATKVNPEALSPEVQRVRASLSAEINGVTIGEQLVAAAYSSTVLEPSKVENLWRQLQRVARAVDDAPA